jgi:ribonuclease HII
MRIAIENLKLSPDYVLVDGSLVPSWVYPSEAVIGGDALSYSIAAASIIAKETRDHIMCEFDAKYPNYGFAKHKGYGTKMHLDAIREFGPCDIHRFSFEPIKSFHTMNAVF